jgi:hypothetical protein
MRLKPRISNTFGKPYHTLVSFVESNSISPSFHDIMQVTSHDVEDAVRRAKSVRCKRELMELACQAKQGALFPHIISRYRYTGTQCSNEIFGHPRTGVVLNVNCSSTLRNQI